MQNKCLILGSTGLFNFFLTKAGIHAEHVVLHNKLGGEIFRYSFGHPHPNVLHMTYFIFCCLFLYRYKNDIDKLLHWNHVLLIGNFLLFIYTVSYTGVLVGLIYYLGILIFGKYKDINKMDWIIGYGCLTGSIFCSVIIPILLNLEDDRFQMLNRVFNTRLRLLNLYFDSYSTTIWGQGIDDYSRVSYQLDNS